MLRGLKNNEDPTEAQWISAEAALRKLIGQLQARDLYEIPKERGFCLPYAFLRDDGTFGNEISASFLRISANVTGHFGNVTDLAG
ncbi:MULTISPECIES: hypothetical protein [Ralstonia solanacearum species complex]|uniref:hypothetical protein n=1 Tax=Ralstonia solanacearum species complex TaxID=3116862 RepID=UPI001E64DDF5|nr:hypothetical protein [Ralstonia solanacearum]